jgi:hypothetical protein
VADPNWQFMMLFLVASKITEDTGVSNVREIFADRLPANASEPSQLLHLMFDISFPLPPLTLAVRP